MYGTRVQFLVLYLYFDGSHFKAVFLKTKNDTNTGKKMFTVDFENGVRGGIENFC